MRDDDDTIFERFAALQEILQEIMRELAADERKEREAKEDTSQ